MNPFTTTKAALEENTKLAKEYGENELEFYKMKTLYLASSLGYSISKKLLTGMFVMVFLLFSSVALALMLGEWVNNLPLGFLLVGTLYLALSALVYVFRKKIEVYIVTQFSKHFY